jgi:membrane-associated phospholipid phosphatase
VRLTPAFLALLCIAQPLAAQARKPDAKPRQRVPAKPVIRVWEVGAMVGITAGAMLIDERVRNALNRDTANLPSILVRFGDAAGNPVYVFPLLLGGTVAGRVLGSKGLEGVSWRAFESVVLASGTTLILKSAIGRRRPEVAPHTPFSFRPFTFHGNSLPSGHTTIAFALATSLSSETKDHWTDILFYGAATLTGYSRVNDDKHWLSDIAFGAALGIVSARVVHRWHRPFVITPGGVGLSLAF